MVSFTLFSRRKAEDTTQQTPKIEPQDGAAGGNKMFRCPLLARHNRQSRALYQFRNEGYQNYLPENRRYRKTANITPENIRFGLIAFRDHPPQDKTYVTKNFGFTSKISTMEKNLKSLKASGGGDGPEAQTAALAEALNMKWEENAAKMVVLITDAPPHGIGEDDDGFDSSPDQNDPLEIARQMAEHGITLFVVACEPELSAYNNAVDFYTALTEITSGKLFPLTLADRLGDYIAGTAIETIETEKLISEYSKDVVENVYGQSRPIEEVMDDVHAKLQGRNHQMCSMTVENPYRQSNTAETNVARWKSSNKVVDGRYAVSSVSIPDTSSLWTCHLIVAPAFLAQIDGPRMQQEYASGSKAPELTFGKSSVDYAQAKRVVMQSVMRSSKVTSSVAARLATPHDQQQATLLSLFARYSINNDNCPIYKHKGTQLKQNFCVRSNMIVDVPLKQDIRTCYEQRQGLYQLQARHISQGYLADAQCRTKLERFPGLCNDQGWLDNVDWHRDRIIGVVDKFDEADCGRTTQILPKTTPHFHPDRTKRLRDQVACGESIKLKHAFDFVLKPCTCEKLLTYRKIGRLDVNVDTRHKRFIGVQIAKKIKAAYEAYLKQCQEKGT
ncbi:hypothetical protein M413DRAFT_26047 [Hebeloma cylindrosporum]|uniref:VWFA domain-containing protein n=1 Tax=Hebeloma cylindrosporum TaxID=76867 RepID=A0A0C3C4E8_HEBCY|nr:hypothetical protein M413DRAFT_26047 [Hebeloma cylindrosporum h7]